MTTQAKIEPKRLMAKAKVQLLIKYPFYGCLLMNLDDIAAPPGHPIWENAPTPTLATDGHKLYYAPSFVETLTLDELMGVLCHEVLHCAFAHLARRGYRDPQRWNIATDIVVNNSIMEEGLKLPAGGLSSEALKGLPAEGVYNRIQIQKAQKPKPGQGQGQGGCEKCKAQGSGHQQVKDTGSGNSIDGHLMDNHDPWQKKPGEDGEGDADDFSELEWKDKVAIAITNAKAAGKMPAHLQSMFEELLHPTLDWKELLAAFVQSAARSSYRMHPPNKRFLHIQMYLPTVAGESLEVVVGVDTSGSVSDPELQRFMSEIMGITQQFDDWEIHVIQCDAAVHRYDHLTPYEGDVPHKAEGRGGTNFGPVFREIEKRQIKAPVMVYMTDGFPNDGWPAEPDYPVLWVLTPRHGDAPWGQQIVLDDDSVEGE